MITLTLAEIAAIIGGQLRHADGSTPVRGKVEFDSRRIVPGDLFLAIPGEHADGADFAQAACKAGAVAVITTRDELGKLPVLTVAEPVAAITDLAREVAARLSATVIGVTGSSGKTSTKDLLAQVLARHGPTVAPPGSFNNELGFPYTVLLADEQTRFLILENSARGLGHITHLTSIAAPQIAAVLNVGTAHLGVFGSAAAIAQAKGELVEALPRSDVGGVAVLNADDPVVLAMGSRTRARILTFGEHRNAEIRAENVRVDDRARASFDLVHGDERVPVALTVHGEHQISNALAAAAVCVAAGVSLAAVADGLSRAESASRWRMEILDTPAGVTVINDSYNANPESMRAGLKALATMSRGRRSVAVLGHMGELGEESITEHDSIGRLIVRLDISKLIAVGELARPIAHGAALEGSWNSESEWTPDVEAAIERLRAYLEPGDVVLVKGSRAAGMERVASALCEPAQADA